MQFKPVPIFFLLLLVVTTIIKVSSIVNNEKPLKSISVDKYVINVVNSGKAVYIFGEITSGLAKNFQKIINENPNVTNVILESPGGSVGESRLIARIILDNGFNTYALNFCVSACVNIFVSGTKRYLFEGANLGIHRYRYAKDNLAVNSASLEREQKRDAAFFERQNVTRGFINKMFKADSNDMWFPNYFSLISSKLIHGVIKPSSFFEKSFFEISKNSLHVIFDNSKVFSTLKEQEPELYAKLLNQLVEIVTKGATLDEVERATSRILLPLINKRLSLAAGPELIKFYRMKMDLYRSLLRSDPFLCVKFMSPEHSGVTDPSRFLNLSQSQKLEIYSILDDILISSYENKALEYDEAEAEIIIKDALRPLKDKIGYIEKGAELALSNKDEYYQYCSENIMIIDEILKLDERKAAMGLRYLQQGSR